MKIAKVKPKLNLNKVEELQKKIQTCNIESQNEIISLIREALGYNKAQFARQIGVDPVTVARWEHKKSPKTPTMTLEQCRKLDDELKKINLSVCDLPDIMVILTTEDVKSTGVIA